MLKSLLPSDTLFLVNNQAFSDEIFGQIRDKFTIRYFLRVDSIYELEFICSLPWSSAMQHFVKNQPN